DYLYLQYDLDGNTTVPLTDFTDGDLECSRFPELILDPDGNLMVIEDSYPGYFLWKLDKLNGSTMINELLLVAESLPEMSYGIFRTLNKVPEKDEYFLTWTHNWGGGIHRIYNLVFDSEGSVLVDWHIAYNYDYEDPEDLYHIDGVTDEAGNLYVVYSQVETEPQIDYFPTFGWFDYDYVSIGQQQTAVVPGVGFSFSCNPVTGSVTVQTTSESQTLRVFDISGREVSSISVSDGADTWSGTGFCGERLPTGIYNIVAESGFIQRITLLGK
ncbi:MAG: FlgD immunoglobulin-like domain containing protein, partial [Candidatus Neomarinimicrobiota bacterium]